jgi:hypothetical protein
MNPAQPAPSPLSTGTISSKGVSAEALFVDKETERERTKLQESFTLGFLGKGTYDQLFELAEDCSETNWDGYEAEPVTQDAYLAAYRFLEALPLGTPAPALGAEPDGHIALEWYHSPRRVLSVSVSPDCELVYAALLPGPTKATGRVPFVGSVPSGILTLIKEVVPCDILDVAIKA